jgi:6,7-dimethyl-8-ribityllumazine synthase
MKGTAAPASASAAGLRIGILAARYNTAIVEGLLEGARAAWRAADGDAAALRVEWVPGAFELPLAVQALARRGQCDALVALGCVIRGETAHFEYVAGECARGLQQVMLNTGIPVAFGVLTTETLAQAEARARPGADNKGAEAVQAALAMARLVRSI